jgi:hypothetical protein
MVWFTSAAWVAVQKGARKADTRRANDITVKRESGRENQYSGSRHPRYAGWALGMQKDPLTYSFLI